MRLALTLFTCLLITNGFTQVIDFENLPHLKPGDPVGEISLLDSDYKMQFYIGYSLEDTLPMRIQKVGYNSNKGGFYGPDVYLDCNGKPTELLRANTINGKNYALNSSLTNRERVGCHFISAVLEAEVIPSIFILYNKPLKQCSADLLDVDGHNNTIEAYDIYCYATAADYPLSPVNTDAIEVRSLGTTFGKGLIGDNGGVMPITIDLLNEFTIIEIRPIQLVNRRNDLRTVFGFALDNFSPVRLEKAPFIPPYLSGNEQAEISVENLDKPLEVDKLPVKLLPAADAKELVTKKGELSVYFDFDDYGLTTVSKNTLLQLIELYAQHPTLKITLTGFTDAKGSDAYNLVLSQQRVERVFNFLVNKGIERNNLVSDFKGEQYTGIGKTAADKRTVSITYSYDVLE